jgi:hypothetical protein
MEPKDMTRTERHITQLSITKRLVRVIRDPADPLKDYYLVEPRADALYARGELVLREDRSGRFDYATQDRREVR